MIFEGWDGSVIGTKYLHYGIKENFKKLYLGGCINLGFSDLYSA